MYRKRKTVSPSFRMPVPYNPITGSDNPLYGPYKPYARFILTEDLTYADEEAKAEISTTYQWGPGLYHIPDVIVHVHNLLTKSDGLYHFHGLEGDAGFAVWDRDNHWRVIVLDTGDVGCCLADDHPGRGSEFLLHVGTWSTSAHKWIYDMSTTYYGIDWRYGVPYPSAGATGLFSPRPSDNHGVIYECVSLDCSSPGPCNEA